MVQWLRLCTSNAGNSIPGPGTEIPHALRRAKKKNLHAHRSLSVNCGPSPFSLQALPTQRLVVQSTAPGGKGGQVSLTVHGTQQVHSPPEVGGGPFSHPPRPSPQRSEDSLL